jgi:hypothetical protein
MLLLCRLVCFSNPGAIITREKHRRQRWARVTLRSSVSNGSITKLSKMLALMLDRLSVHIDATARAAATVLLHGCAPARKLTAPSER